MYNVLLQKWIVTVISFPRLLASDIQVLNVAEKFMGRRGHRIRAGILEGSRHEFDPFLDIRADSMDSAGAKSGAGCLLGRSVDSSSDTKFELSGLAMNRKAEAIPTRGKYWKPLGSSQFPTPN